MGRQGVADDLRQGHRPVGPRGLERRESDAAVLEPCDLLVDGDGSPQKVDTVKRQAEQLARS